MLITELREIIKKYNEDELRYLISEIYKSIPKKLKDEKNLDYLISDLSSYKQNGAVKKEKNVDFGQLKADIILFCTLAQNSLYFAPNRIVHKNERSKWRFKVKAFVKDLDTFKMTSPEGMEVAQLYEMLYKVLSKACGEYLFPSTDPFSAIGISQPDFLDRVFIRKYVDGFNEKNIKSGIELVINSVVDSETLPISLINVFLQYMKTNDARIIAIEQCKITIDEIKSLKSNDKKKKELDFYQIDKINNLVEIVFRLYAKLGEIEEAISFFKKNYIERDKEVLLYVLLELMYLYKLDNLWRREYELAVNKGIKPRKMLEKMYNYVLENGVLPEEYYL